MINKIVIIFSGRIGSGKSSVSDFLSKVLQWPRVGFGDYVRKIAAINEISASRQNLQDLGQSLVDLDPVSFCISVLNQADYIDKSFIIDGLRHTLVLETLKHILFNYKFIHIHLLVSDVERHKRFTDQSQNLKEVDFHRSELEVINTLASNADLIVDTSNKSTKDLSKEIITWLGEVKSIQENL